MWRNYDGYHKPDGNAAIFELDGRVMGRGRKGFENVLQELRSLPKGSTLIISWEIIDTDPQRPPYTMPYEALELGEEYFKVIVDRALVEDYK